LWAWQLAVEAVEAVAQAKHTLRV